MTTLVTGGTGKTGSHVARLLHDAGYPLVVASRKGVAAEPFKVAKFDYSDPTTFENPFIVDPNIDRLYLVTPDVEDQLGAVRTFIDFALTKGVKRIVYVGSSAPLECKLYSPVWKYITTLGVEYTILRPTWFIENFSEAYGEFILYESSFSSITGDARIPFISVEDIAAAAFDALTKKESPNSDFYLLGPDAYSYDEAAALLSEILGRKITHQRITFDEAVEKWTGFGVPKGYVVELMKLEEYAGLHGTEEAALKEPNVIRGKKSLKEYFLANRSRWIPQ